jgi:hypothetical protein
MHGNSKYQIIISENFPLLENDFLPNHRKDQNLRVTMAMWRIISMPKQIYFANFQFLFACFSEQRPFQINNKI